MVARPPLPTNYNLRGPQIKRTVSPTDRFFIVHKGNKGHKYFYWSKIIKNDPKILYNSQQLPTIEDNLFNGELCESN